MTVYIDIKILYNSRTGILAATQKRFPIDLTILLQAYKVKKIPKVVWTPSIDNPANAMTIL